MASGGQSNRSQFQIGKASLRSRRLCRRSRAQSRGGPGLTWSPLANSHSPIATGFAYSSHPVSRIPAILMKTKGIRSSTDHTMPRRSFVTNHDSRFTNHFFSNRYTARVECLLTHSKQTSLVLSNRYKFVPPGRVTSWLPPPSTHRISNRYIPRIEIAVTPSKQTTVVLSTRYKRPPPRGVLLCNAGALIRHPWPRGRRAPEFPANSSRTLIRLITCTGLPGA